ncbi:hypothetical protein H2202_010125 [Exophiala xenobiotica]|nr:hypothetical protein H2202_010125 [Exophiala xenobiotica]
MGSLASLIVTQPDLSRYCRKVSDAGWLQGLCVFISKCLVFFLGLAATASIQGAWGKAYWNIWDLLDAILDHYWTAGARCAVFLLMIVDYYWVRRGNLHTPSLFKGKKGDLYFFTRGFNLRAYFAWLTGFLFGLPGMIGRFHPTAVNEAAKNMYRMGWPLTFTVTSVTYAALVYFLPVQIYPESHANTPTTFEYLGKRDCFFEDDVDEDLVRIHGVEATEDKAPVISEAKL